MGYACTVNINEEMDNVRYFSFVSEQEEYFPLIWHKGTALNI